MELKIHPEITDACPFLRLGIMEAQVLVSDTPPALIGEIERVCKDREEQLEIAEINTIPTIMATRNGYKALGKDPSRYRPSAEALLRRVVNGKGLYQVNNVVDIINLVSIETGFSIGGYDVAKIEGATVLAKGKPGAPYDAIGRGTLNIENLPVFHDDMGPFGSPTSDSTRTSIQPETTIIRLAIFDFDGRGDLEDAQKRFMGLLIKFAEGQHFGTLIQ